MFKTLFQNFNQFFQSLPLDTVMYAVWGSYLSIFALTLLLCLLSRHVRGADKRPFLCLTNAYAGVNLAAMLLFTELSGAVLFTAIFWVVGYLLYGFLCLISNKKPAEKTERASMPLSAAPVSPAPRRTVKNEVPAAKAAVKLDHAATVTDKLLEKNLAKTDRQELEKMKNTLAVLQIKGSLTPVESDILNDNFNALLKLMAKYNV